MLDHVDALPPAVKRAGKESWRQAVVLSVSDRCEVPEFIKCEAGRDAYPLHDHRGDGIGPVVVASAWLAFYIIAAIHSFIASGN